MMKKLTGAIVASVILGMAGTANATVIINVTEVGGDVVFSTTGSLDLTGAAFVGLTSGGDGIIPGGSNWFIGSGAGVLADIYTLTSVAGAFGTSLTFFSPPTSTFGDVFFVHGNPGGTELVGVPTGYISGAPIISGMTFSSATIAGFTMIPGTYNYTIPNDNIILNIGQVDVPEPATLALFAIALGGLGFMTRRHRRYAQEGMS